MAGSGRDARTSPSVLEAAGVIAAYARRHLGSERTASTELLGSVREPWNELRRRSTASELVLAFAVVPVVLVSLEATVHARQWALPLTAGSVTDPDTALLAFTSSFVHAGPTHLRGNVVGYLLIVSALYPLAVLSGRKRELAGLSVCNLLAVPLVTGQLSLLLPGTGATLGFSSVNTALLGGLLLFVFFAWDTETGEMSPVWAVGPAFASLALALAVAPTAFPYMPPVGGWSAVVGLASGLLAVLFVHRNGTGGVAVPQNPVLYWGVAVLLVGFARYLVFVPGNANLLAHLGGFYVGFFGLFVAVVGGARRRIHRTARALGEAVSRS